VGNATASWVCHTDQMPNPKLANVTILYVKETSDVGGETLTFRLCLISSVIVILLAFVQF
jgi:hypothetical protein